MCVVSMVVDHYGDKWKERLPYPGQMIPPQPEFDPKVIEDLINRKKPQPPVITPEEIAEFRKLLERAREYDKRNNEPECELESKKQALKTIAKALGVEIDFL